MCVGVRTCACLEWVLFKRYVRVRIMVGFFFVVVVLGHLVYLLVLDNLITLICKCHASQVK